MTLSNGFAAATSGLRPLVTARPSKRSGGSGATGRTGTGAGVAMRPPGVGMKTVRSSSASRKGSSGMINEPRASD